MVRVYVSSFRPWVRLTVCARLPGRSVPDHAVERVRARHRHLVRGVRRGGGGVLGVWRRPVRRRHRDDDRTSAWPVLEALLVLHKSRVPASKCSSPLIPSIHGGL